MAICDFIIQTPVFADSTSEPVEIDIHTGSSDPSQHLTFYPSSISAFVGQIILFGNGDTVPHEIISGIPSSGPDGKFDSGIMKPGQYFSYTITQSDSGTIRFYDESYQWMTGIITVQQSSSGYTVIHNVGTGASVSPGQSSQQTMLTPTSSSVAATSSQQQVKLTDGGLIYVEFSVTPANPTPGSQAVLHVSFIGKYTRAIQPHIDYYVIVTRGDQQILGSGSPDTPLHTAKGSVDIPIQFPADGTYQVKVGVEGIVFQPISTQTATFSFSVGGPQNPVQEIPIITASTDKTLYNYGDTITVSVNIQHAVVGTILSSVITGPSNEIVYKGEGPVNVDGSFTGGMRILGPLWTKNGTYHYFLQYGSTGASVNLPFTVNYNVPNFLPSSNTVVDLTKQIISTTPEDFSSDNASSIALKCKAFFASQIWVEAYEYCDRDLQLEPQNADAQNDKDYAYSNMTQIVSNIVQADDSLNAHPNDEAELATKASALVGLGRYNDSLVYENKVLQMDPSDSEELRVKATTLFFMGRYSDALQSIDNAILYPLDYQLKIGILYSNGKYDEAILYVDEFYKQLGGGTQHSEDLDNFEKSLIYEKMGKQDMANEYSQLALNDGGLSAVNLDVLKARMYYHFLMDFGKALEYAKKVPPDSAYYTEASYMKVICNYYLSKSENQSQVEISALEVQPTLTANATGSTPANATQIPNWIRNNAKWWSQGQVGDQDFVKGIQYLIEQGILKVPNLHSGSSSAQTIPTWVKTSAGWWASGKVSDNDFLKGIEYLVRLGIVKI
ncbi:MAG: hypothetical protein KGI27_06825 [Thaumarchaeota archaeon]|nr:hypothetical protein [Nitrososphaerota archaeon]